jgi:hypothetical protein
MKRALAVVFLLMSFVSIALADGSGPPPNSPTKPTKPASIQIADGSGPPPTGTPKQPQTGRRIPA